MPICLFRIYPQLWLILLMMMIFFSSNYQRTPETLKKLKMVHQLFDELVEASQKLNSANSLSVFCILIGDLINITMTLFFCIGAVLQTKFFHLIILTCLTGGVLIVLAVVDLPAKEVSSNLSVQTWITIQSFLNWLDVFSTL